MSIQEPAWLKRTRPCPFFSQGRCLFADSCNFLHDVKVRSGVNQPLLSTTVKQPPLPPKPVFHPPSVVVNSASPGSVNLASPQSPVGTTQNSSRYSGLLSVLSDVIGPLSNPPTADDAVPPRTVSAISSSFRSAVHGRTGLPSESDPVVAGFEPTSDASGIETDQSAPRHAELPSILEPDSETTSVDPFGHQMGCFPPAADDALLAEFLPVPDHEESGDGDATSYFVETYIIEPPEAKEEGHEDEDMGGCGEDDPAVMVSNRQSTFSSFTGASLLASPRHSIFEDGASPIEDHSAVDLLSPVQLSTKLRPFPVPPLGSRVKRGDSIDSGYADGDSWGPLPFPRSPPGSFRPPVTFPSHSGRASLSFSSLKARRVSYDAIALRPPPYNPTEVTKEVDNSEDNEDTKYTILGAYAMSPSGEQGEGGACDPLQVNAVGEKAKEDDRLPSEVPAVVRSPWRYSPKHLHPTREYDLDSCNQPSFTSDDNVSFKTALSTQPSYGDLSNISRVSPVEQDSLLSSISYRSTSDTSVLSHCGDANGLLDESIVDSHVCESSFLVATTSMGCQIDSTEALKIRASEECPLAKEVAIDSNVPFAPASAEDLRGLVSEKVVAPRRCFAPLCVDGHQKSGPEHVTPPQERLLDVSRHDRHSPKSSPSTEGSYSLSSCKDVLGCTPADASDVQEFDLQKRPSDVLHFDKRSPKPGPFAESPRSLSSVKDIPGYTSQGVDGSHEELLADVVAPRERLPGGFHFEKHLPNLSSPAESSYSPSSVKDVPSYTPPGASNAQEFVRENDVAPQERLSCLLHFDTSSPRSGLSTESSQSSSVDKDVLGYLPPNTNGSDSMSSESSPAILHGCLAEHDAVGAGQSLLVENDLEPDEVTESFDSEGDSFTQRLSFSLPPFVPDEIVGQPTLSSEKDTEAAFVSLKKDVPNAYVVSQDEEMQRIRSGFDLTEKARPRQLPSVGSPDFTLRRSRAASDLTVKANSPLGTTPWDTPNMLRSPPPPEQPGRSDSVQSLYDQYFDDGTSDDHSLSSSPAHKDTASPDMSSHRVEPSQEINLQSLDLIPRVLQGVPSPSFDSKPGNSGTDSPRSETILRPLLTGRRSFLRSSLAQFIPKANPANHKESSSPTYAPPRLQARVIGSTMVPLGFRRHKPQPAVTQPLQSASQSLHTVRPTSELREVLRIRTDITREDAPRGCSSASHVSFPTRSPSPAKAMSAPPTGGLKRLRLSSIINKRSSILSTHSSSIAPSILSLDHTFNPSAPQSPTVSSITSFSRNSSFSSSCEQIPEQIHHFTERPSSNSLILQPNDDAYFAPQSSSTGRDSRSVSPPIQQPKSWRLSCYRAGSRNYTSADSTARFSRRTSTLSLSYAVAEEQEIADDSAISHPIQSKYTDDSARPASVLVAPVHAIATPKPTLLFAIASDDVDQVRQVLESGEAGPNDSVGPQSALAFTLTNDKLAHKQEIVKALLAYGANPSALRNPTLNPAPRVEGDDEPSGPPPETTSEGMDPATRYFVARADTAHTRQTSQLIYRSFFRPLTRVRYDVIGQDWALEQLFRVLSMHSQKLAVAPIVVLLCGPSGHGKSLLARKFGSLLDVPTHTVNMTTLRSTHDIWQSYSMSPYEEPSSCTLAEFLIENEGKRCVVVLDEIEKVEDQKALWSLLMPWELGRCSLMAGKRHVDARNVIWLGTSNVGHELVFEHHENRAQPDTRMSREDYLELTSMLRPRVSHCLGASLVSRVTTVLPFVPFTLDEKKAIAAEAVYALAGDASKRLSPPDVESLVTKVLPSYHPSEGARSLHRAISNILVDAIS